MKWEVVFSQQEPDGLTQFFLLFPCGYHLSSPLQETIALDCSALWEHWSCLKKETDVLKKQGQPAEEPLGREPTISFTDHDKELVQLRQEIQRSWDFIAWQQRCFQEQISSGEELPAHLRGSYFLEEEQRLKEAQALFAQEQAHFKVERHRFTEAAIRLGHARQRLEGERALFLKEQLLEFSLYSSSQANTLSSCLDLPGLQNRDPLSWCPVSCSNSGLSKSPGRCPCVPECYHTGGVYSLPHHPRGRVHWDCCKREGNDPNFPPDLLDGFLNSFL
ncbi:afadin- and alpha-actinin-binding protein-like [Elephas maximus indicus]|uniref:afadin- and alpha-actinin-binding protein-like n=1 Tax=Elephas maximus indicus TaxID=99487 RepID=UPI002115F92C|nr:afadin- and alpha-actinin-binding protein-like [Elephas maximus indicus]